METVYDITATVDDYEAPALPTGATLFWRDDNGDWQTVEVIDCEPRGWGWCCIQWSNYDGTVKHAKSVPVLSLCDLDTYLNEQADYPDFEAATREDQYRKSAGALGYVYL